MTKSSKHAANDNAPLPILPPKSGPAPFPLDTLGPLLAPAARAAAELVQAAAAIAGTSALAAATLAVQSLRNVRLPTGDVRPISLFFMPIAESGDRKSATDAKLLAAANRYQLKLIEEFEATEAERAKDDERPSSSLPILLMDDPTPEGLYRTFRDGRPSGGLFTDEAGRFLGSHAMSPDMRLRTATTLSNFWDGKPLTRVRAGEPTSALVGRRLSLNLMAQPSVAGTLTGDEMVRGQGLLSRILPTEPESMKGQRLFRRPDPAAQAEIAKFSGHLEWLLNLPLPMHDRIRGAIDCSEIALSVEAEEIWIAFHDEIEVQLKRDGRLRPVSDLAGKLPEHAARIAAVLALFEDPLAVEVTAHHMEGAAELARHYVAEGLRLLAPQGGASSELVMADKLGRWLLERYQDQVVSLPDIAQRATPTACRNVETARKMLAILEDRNWIVKEPGKRVVNGQNRQEVWHVRPQPSGSP